MQHSSTHPCTWWDQKSNSLHSCGEYRTIGNCIKNPNEWRTKGKVLAQAQNFKNCINIPLLWNRANDDALILDLIPPPRLHLLLGGFNTPFNHISTEFSD